MRLTLLAALAGALLLPATAALADGTKGEVTKVDTRRNKVTIRHEAITNLDMPAMTMVFDVADPAMMDRLAVGKSITFTADRVNGKLTIVGVD